MTAGPPHNFIHLHCSNFRDHNNRTGMLETAIVTAAVLNDTQSIDPIFYHGTLWFHQILVSSFSSTNGSRKSERNLDFHSTVTDFFRDCIIRCRNFINKNTTESISVTDSKRIPRSSVLHICRNGNVRKMSNGIIIYIADHWVRLVSL